MSSVQKRHVRQGSNLEEFLQNLLSFTVNKDGWVLEAWEEGEKRG